MNILFLTDNFPPEVNAPATRTYEHCLEWVALGAHVTVITCVPNFPHGNVYEGYKNKLYQTVTINGIRVIRVWTYITANAGFAKRVADYLSFAFSSFFSGLFEKADIILATSPQFFTTFSACALSKFKGKPWIFELRDLWPESIKTVGAMRNRRALSFLERIELFLYRDADMIIALTPAFKQNLVSRGIDAKHVEVVTNGSNFDLFTPQQKDPGLLKKLNLNDKFVVGYIGTHGMAHSLEFIVDAIGRMGENGTHFLFIGDGAKKQDVANIAKEKHIRNITFLDSIPKEKVPQYMSVMDAALVPLLKSETFKTVIPSKIFEAAAMRKPILLGVEGQAKEIVERYGAGVCFEPENESDFIRKLNELKGNPGLYSTLQDGCARLAADFDRRRLAREMYGYIEEIVKTGWQF